MSGENAQQSTAAGAELEEPIRSSIVCTRSADTTFHNGTVPDTITKT